MGTPAIPNLGQHCTVDTCRLIDFLPFTCDCCNQVYCLEHRSYIRHNCPKANQRDITVVICPLCAKGVRLIPDEDPNITWESHVNIECDPSNYENATKKKKCPVKGCREILTFSNSIKCRDCDANHCLKHRFGPDHTCPGPKKPESNFPFTGFFNRSTKGDSKKVPEASSSKWGRSFLNAASSIRAKWNASESNIPSSSLSGQVEVCPQCNLRFSSVMDLFDHVEKIHEKRGVLKATLDVCPQCSQGFRDPVTLVEHVEKEHGGASKSNRR